MKKYSNGKKKPNGNGKKKPNGNGKKKTNGKNKTNAKKNPPEGMDMKKFNKAYKDLQNRMDKYPPASKIKDIDSLRDGFRNYMWLARVNPKAKKGEIGALNGFGSKLDRNTRRYQSFGDELMYRSANNGRKRKKNK